MRRFIALGLGLVLSVLLVAVAVAAAPKLATSIPSIGIQNIHLDKEFVWSERPTEMSAFIETGSLNPRCLATFSETNFAEQVSAKTLYCNPRQITRDGRPMNGLAVRIFFDESVPTGFTLDVNYYQEGMRTNPAPIPCDGDC